MADRFEVIDAVDPGDGYSKDMSGLPDRLVSLTFRNGAKLYIATNHLFMAYPTFGVSKGLAPAFNTTIPGLTKVIGYMASGLYSTRSCAGSSMPDNLHAGAEDPVGLIDELQVGGFTGELYLMDMDMEFKEGDDVMSGFYTGAADDHKVKNIVDPPQPGSGQITDCCFTEAARDRVAAGDLSFGVKAVPTHMQYNVRVPFIHQDFHETPTDASNYFHLMGSNSFPHACEPGLPDMGAAGRRSTLPLAPRAYVYLSSLSLVSSLALNTNVSDRIN